LSQRYFNAAWRMLRSRDRNKTGIVKFRIGDAVRGALHRVFRNAVYRRIGEQTPEGFPLAQIQPGVRIV